MDSPQDANTRYASKPSLRQAGDRRRRRGWDETARPPARARILIIDADAKSRKTVRELLWQSGHLTLESGDGRAGLRAFYDARPDLVLMDLAIPELNGWQLLARIRELSSVPTMIVRAKGKSELERVRALRSGADDVLDKPFNHQELLARVGALLRRARADTATAVYADGFIQIDFPERAVRAGGRDVSLSPLEFRMLTAFVRHPNEVLDRDRLRELVWGGVPGVLPEQVKLDVSYLRRKLGTSLNGGSPIETVRGFGYIYRPARAPSSR